MKIGGYQKLDEALYIWFRQQREKGLPVTGPILSEKAKILFPLIYSDVDNKSFTASSGFLWRFCRRHGLKELSVQGEKASADVTAATIYLEEFPSLIEGYTKDQVFNCDETGLYYRLLPQKTLASVFETRADGWKKAKDRVTISACANITGSIKLPLLFIGKYARPRCFRNLNLDALQTYMNQKSAWVNAHIFSKRN